MKLLGSLLLSAASALKCQVCQESRNTIGDIVGQSQKGCFDGGVTSFEKECADGEICTVESIIDWMPRGDHIYNMKRSCAPKLNENEPPCLSYSGSVNFKDCRTQCDTDNCNKDNEEIYKLTSEGGTDKQESCNVCSYYQNLADGSVSGDADCHNEVTPGDKYQTPCEPYANHGCFDSASYHKGIGGDFDGEQFEDFYRGCTPFALEETDASWSKCETVDVGGLTHLSCKSTCKGKDCNTSEHQIKSQCYTCKGTRDGAGRNVGSSDDRCWDNLQAQMLADCDIDEVCYDDLQIDWLSNGHYLRSITRGCVKKEDIGADQWQNGTYCEGGSISSGHYQYRDCKKVCEGTACNADLSVGDLFATKEEGDEPQKCQQCAYLEFDDGHREGFPSCLNSADPNRLVECPSFGDHGCYTATNMHIEDGEEFVQVERGCATFGIEDGVQPGLDCYDSGNLDGVNDQNIAVCKDYCLSNNCNNKQPTLPNQSGSAWPSCVTCEVYFNDMEEVLGIGNQMDCRGDWDTPGPNGEYVMSREAVAKYAQRCPSKGDYCLTDMEVDWLPRGDITYRITRGCSSKPATETCTGGASALIQYRDCQHDCAPRVDGNECNDDLEEISRRMNDGRNHVSQCVQCSYKEDADGNVIGDPNCPFVPDLGDEDLAGLTNWCPAYARVACASAASFHATYNESSTIDVTEDYRHCSPFDSFPETDCVFQKINGLDHVNCKNTCRDDNNCNKIRIERGNQCYACTGTVDALGNPVGLGDPNCFENLHSGMLIDCRPEESYCVSEMTADWEPKGDQVYRIIRGCAERPAKETCDVGSNTLLKFKDCWDSCENESGPCNSENAVYDKMSSMNVNKCQTCYWEEQDNGNVSGNRRCEEKTEGEEFSKDCPRYARESCFAGAAKHIDFGKEFKQIYKGCSSFKLDMFNDEDGEEENMISLPDDSGNMAQYSLTKKTCGDNDCNTEHKDPTKPGEESATLCQVCNVVVDQFNQTIGIGNKDCWEGGNSDFQQDCGVGQYCSTDLEIDWLPRGQHQFRLVRGCTSNPPSYDEPCDEGSSRNGKYKDCRVSCNPRVEGNSCNTDLDRVADKFVSLVYMSGCYACEYYEDFDGNVKGNKNCAKLQIAEDSFAGAMLCPKYAHASCYTASSYHIDYSDPDAGINGNQFEDYFRGCSPFVEHNGDWWGKHCEQSSINGFEHENCKELCFGPYCNLVARDPKPQCHTCSVTLDSEGNTVGTSDPNCLADLTDSSANIQECPMNMPYCTDVMEIDWYGRGMQYVHFNRGCTREPRKNECVDLTEIIDANLMAKLCTSESCDAKQGPCNKDLKVTENFYPMSGNGVKSCTTCKYAENDDGTVSGNVNCGEKASDDMSRECEPWLSSACFVGSASHQQVGIDKYETYKGCSYFTTDGVERTDDFIGGVAYKTVKESCTGDNCNKNKYNKP